MAAAVAKNVGIVSGVETITPELAEQWLEKHNRGNRIPSEADIDKLCREIQGGRWLMDGNSIKFSKGGRLLDGQHRLFAIWRSGRSAESIVTRGLKEDAMDTIDTGKKRTNGDLMKINMGDEQMASTTAYSSIAAFIGRLQRGDIMASKTIKLSFPELRAIYEEYEHDIRWAYDQIGYRVEPNQHSGGAPVLAAFAYCRRIDKNRMEALAYEYKHYEGVSGKTSSQAKAMRAAVTLNSKASNQVRIRMASKALRGIEAYLNKEPLTQLKEDSGVLERIQAMRGGAK